MSNLSRRGFLTSAAALLGTPLLMGLGGQSSRRLLLINVEGGWDPTFALDSKLDIPHIQGPKPDVTGIGMDRELVHTFGDNQVIQFNPSRRPNVANLFHSYGPAICVINGLWVGAVTHEGGRVRLLTGTDDRSLPDLATMVGVERGIDTPIATVDFSGLARFGVYTPMSARFGRSDQLSGLLDPASRMEPTIHSEYRGVSLPDEDRQAMLEYLMASREVDTLAGLDRGKTLASDRMEALERSERLRQARIRPGAPPTTLRGQLQMAMELFETGACQSVTVQTNSSWDRHSGAGALHDLWNATAEDLHYLIGELRRRNLDESVTVAVLSEMGRSPLRNDADGTDHWPHTSAMLFGAGIAGGRMLGATDDELLSQPVDFQTGNVDPQGKVLRPEHLLAGLLETLQVDPEAWLPGVEPYRGQQT